MIPEDTPIKFCYEYFQDAVYQAYYERKPLLLIFADLSEPTNLAFLNAILEDDVETWEALTNEWLVYGIENGQSAEAQNLTIDFGIAEVPFFASIMPRTHADYSTLEEYKDPLDHENFRDFLKRSKDTFRLL